jgi:hypothetical protein
MNDADRAEALRLARVFDARTEDSHDIIDAATLLSRLATAPPPPAAPAVAPHAEFARLLAEQVLHMDMVTDRGIRARELARQVLDANEESPAELALRSLASWLGAGGYNAPTVDAKAFEEKIRWGVEEVRRAAAPAVAVEPTQAQAALALLKRIRYHAERHSLPREWLTEADEVLGTWGDTAPAQPAPQPRKD